MSRSTMSSYLLVQILFGEPEIYQESRIPGLSLLDTKTLEQIEAWKPVHCTVWDLWERDDVVISDNCDLQSITIIEPCRPAEIWGVKIAKKNLHFCV